ncbi:hypothetical protein JTB14_038344 [Gonioctena quinquepunctata]|nr:hypothetical protein JTB14_038344 [Gonioctena quinquepunctata]
MNKVKEEATQHAEIHLNYTATFNDEIEEINKNMIRDTCREVIYKQYEIFYRKKYSAEIQKLTEHLERHKKPSKFLRKNRKVELNVPGQGSRELDLGEKDFPPLRQQVKVSKESNTPSKKSRQTQGYAVETSNRYDAIYPDSEPEKDPVEEQAQERDVSEEHSQEIVRTITNKNKQPTPQFAGNADKKVPPIVVEGRPAISKRMTEILKEQLKGKYVLEYKPRSTLIFTTSVEDHASMKRALLGAEAQFHTYTHKGEKTHAFVIKGLESEPTPEELEEALKTEHQLKDMVKLIEDRKALSNKGNRGDEFVDAPLPTKQPWNNHNQNQSLKNTQQPRREERRIQPTQGSPSIPEFRPQVVSGVTGGVSENGGPSFEDITNRFKKLNSLIDLPKMIKRLDSLIKDITNARGEDEQFAALLRYHTAGCGNP